MLSWHPAELPSAQHRAGLAGLAVVHDVLERQRARNLPQLTFGKDGSVELKLTREGLQTLFNHLFEASLEKVESEKIRTKSKGEGKSEDPPERSEVPEIEDPKTQKKKDKTIYIYDQVVPGAPFLAALGVPQPWIKLWRDAIWGVIRGNPKTRGSYEERSKDQPVSEAESVWALLTGAIAKRGRTAKLSGSLYIGAQAKHGDEVPYIDNPANLLLLNFWPVVMGVYVPEAIDRDGKGTFTGYVLAVPDVIDIKNFIDDNGQTLGSLSRAIRGYRPRDSIISVPGEGGLEYLHRLSAVTKARADRDRPFSVSAVELYHLEKVGKNIPLRSTLRVSADLMLLQDYEAIRDKYENTLFRRQLIINLLNRAPWYRGFGKLFSTFPKELFVEDAGNQFKFDVRKRFQVAQNQEDPNQ
jgi:CRISPR-associated protein Cmx8